MQPVKRAAIVTHGWTKNVEGAAERFQAVASAAGVEIVADTPEAEPDIVVVLGGDGTMLRALARFLSSDVPVIGVNFGRVGFLAAIPAAELETGVARVFAGEYRVKDLPTLDVSAAGAQSVAVNDAVVVSAVPGRIVELGFSIGGEDLGTQPCDGLICASPPGSTAYNLSNGGPVLVWGLDAMVVTFVAPHTLHARPLVVGPGTEVIATNRSPDVDAVVLVDGHQIASLPPGGSVTTRLGVERSRLAVLPEQTFFTRYGQVFRPN
ncbi:MAG: NAD(+)/NADH kinase [Actinomycetes bacterium]